MINELPELEKIAVQEHVRRVLGGVDEKWDAPDLHYNAAAIIKAISEIPGVTEVDDGFTQNGWQWDWWQQFTYEGITYEVMGSGYDGGHSFYKADE